MLRRNGRLVLAAVLAAVVSLRVLAGVGDGFLVSGAPNWSNRALGFGGTEILALVLLVAAMLIKQVGPESRDVRERWLVFTAMVAGVVAIAGNLVLLVDLMTTKSNAQFKLAIADRFVEAILIFGAALLVLWPELQARPAPPLTYDGDEDVVVDL